MTQETASLNKLYVLSDIVYYVTKIKGCQGLSGGALDKECPTDIKNGAKKEE